jgi:Holliday junction resolvasome RuvABC endonuclease subunit
MTNQPNLLIMGVDPGLATTGYAFIKDNKKPEVLDYGVISTSSKEEFPTR